MRKIISGRVYDTQMAIKLVVVHNPAAERETLYCTALGWYFVAMGYNHWSKGPGTGIRSMTQIKAQEWVKRWANEEYENIFGKAESA